MPGPPPKPASQRRRRNAAPAVVRLPADQPLQAPPLPVAKASKAMREWWRMAWASPMAHAWLEADVPGLARLASLLELTRGTEQAPLTVLSEVRALEDRYGLSPMARRRLQWEIEQAGGRPAAEVREDEERWLRAID